MESLDRGARSGVTRRQFWQGFLDWLRPVEQRVSAYRHASNSAEVSEVDLGAPVSTALAGGALAGGGALTGPAWSGERAHQSFADEPAHEIDEAELLEFLAADHDPVFADPAFKEELRDQLWTLVQERAGMRPKNH
jgi:hypothetical protein